MASEELIKGGTIVFFILFILYILTGSLLEHKDCGFFHETTFAILFGIIISAIALMAGMTEFSSLFKFDDAIFFYIILPPIIFSAGYNLKKKKFFQHFNYIALFGVLGTIVTFVAFTCLTMLVMQFDILTKYNPTLK
jgi:sodium/hydrogen exchanger 8